MQHCCEKFIPLQKNNLIMKNSILFTLLLSAIFFSSCGDDDPEIPNEEEVINTLIYSLESSSGETVELRFTDPDDDGPIDPIVTSGTLQANTSTLYADPTR